MANVHSLIGIVALGPLVAVALWTHSKAVAGPHVYAAALRKAEQLPGGLFPWTVGVSILFVAHALLSLTLARRDLTSGSSARLARREVPVRFMSGALATALLSWHLLRFSWPRATGQLGANFAHDYAAATFSTTWNGLPLIAWSYALGVACLALYISLRLARIARSQLEGRRALIVTLGAAVIGLAVLVSGWRSLLHFATGWPHDPPPAAGSCHTTKSGPIAPRGPL